MGARGGAGEPGAQGGPPQGLHAGAPSPHLGEEPRRWGGLPEITEQREEAKGAAGERGAETWDENAQCGKP